MLALTVTQIPFGFPLPAVILMAWDKYTRTHVFHTFFLSLPLCCFFFYIQTSCRQMQDFTYRPLHHLRCAIRFISAKNILSVSLLYPRIQDISANDENTETGHRSVSIWKSHGSKVKWLIKEKEGTLKGPETAEFYQSSRLFSFLKKQTGSQHKCSETGRQSFLSAYAASGILKNVLN